MSEQLYWYWYALSHMRPRVERKVRFAGEGVDSQLNTSNTSFDGRPT